MMVSVIIPVFNDEKYVRQATESALSQPETAEVILVEDGSFDQSLNVCLRELTKLDSRVKLFRHPDGRNHGAGASRNLGIRSSSCKYLAFLDADDYFLANRFAKARELFASDRSIDGVYEAVGLHFETKETEQYWPKEIEPLMTIKRNIPPEELFELQSPVGSEGYFHIDGLVARRRMFEKSGFFDETLRLHQDTALFIKCAAACKLVPGELREPVAMRRLHSENRSNGRRRPLDIFRTRLLMWRVLWKWGKLNLSDNRMKLLSDRLFEHVTTPYRSTNNRVARNFSILGQIIYLSLQSPSILVDRYFLKKLLQKL